MLQRKKSPNQGLWSPIGGKLEMETGESPHQCAARETFEEIGLKIDPSQLHLFCMIAEKAYEGSNHWLMFLFDSQLAVPELPEAIAEGRFSFFSREQIDSSRYLKPTAKDFGRSTTTTETVSCPPTSANCEPGQPLEIVVEQVIEGSEGRS